MPCHGAACCLAHAVVKKWVKSAKFVRDIWPPKRDCPSKIGSAHMTPCSRGWWVVGGEGGHNIDLNTDK